jgi:hypothetical protein
MVRIPMRLFDQRDSLHHDSCLSLIRRRASRPTWSTTSLRNCAPLPHFTPNPIHGISYQEGCFLAMRCLPLSITNILFWGSELISYNGRWRGNIVHIAEVHCWDTGGGEGSKAVGVTCFELGVSVRWLLWCDRSKWTRLGLRFHEPNVSFVILNQQDHS